MKEMILAQQQSSDQWAFYQAKAIREHLYKIERIRMETDLAVLPQTLGEDAREKYATQLREVQELGLIEIMRPEGSLQNTPERSGGARPFGSGIRLTPRGRLLSNEVFWRLLP